MENTQKQIDFQNIISRKLPTGRNSSQTFALQEMYKRFGLNQICILETGCIRNPTSAYKIGDGWGTCTWVLWSHYTNSMIYTVDINENHLNIAKKVIGKNPHVHYVLSDSVAYLEKLPESFKIDVLFLDSYDYGDSKEEKLNSANHQLKEMQGVEKNLKDTSLILLDDIFDIETFKGKGFLSIPYILSKGWKIINYADNQVLLSKI